MKISEAEAHILEVFWRTAGPLSADEVIAALGKRKDWSAGTVRTFLARLLKKKALAATRDGRRYLYRPLLRQQDYAHHQSRNLIDQLFGGRVAPFITQFSERERLSREDIEELKRLVRRLENGR
jgi:predicted transcriptional regulator